MTLQRYAVHLRNPQRLGRTLERVIEHGEHFATYDPLDDDDANPPRLHVGRLDAARIRETAARYGMQRQTLTAILGGRLTRVRFETWQRVAAMLDDVELFCFEFTEDVWHTYEWLGMVSYGQARFWWEHAMVTQKLLDVARSTMRELADVPTREARTRGAVHSQRVAAAKRKRVRRRRAA